MTDTLYKKAICGCEVEVTAAYNWMDGVIEVEEVYIVKACEYHRPNDSLEYELENDELEDNCEDDPRRNGAICDCYICVPAGDYPDLCAHCGKLVRSLTK